MFYTRPEISPLNLDLVRLDGGGSCPSQFFGTTADGDSLYVRYRGGWLSFSYRPGSQTEKFLEQRIGPRYHGDILMEQVCDLLGLTLFGTTPPFTEDDRVKAAEKRRILDWSGRTTYWEEELQVTKTGGERFVELLQTTFHDLCILEVEFHESKRRYVRRSSISECESMAVIGIGPIMTLVDDLLCSDDAKLADASCAFSAIIDFRFDWNRRSDREFYKNWENLNSRFFSAFGGEAILAERNSGKISGEFSTSSPKAIEFVARLYEVIGACFSRRACWVDPQGAVLQIVDKTSLHSRDLEVWCRQSTVNYIGWAEDDFGHGKVVAGLRAL